MEGILTMEGGEEEEGLMATVKNCADLKRRGKFRAGRITRTRDPANEITCCKTMRVAH